MVSKIVKCLEETNFYFFADIDECVKNLDNCDINAQGNNTDGSFVCMCNTGYSGNGLTCIAGKIIVFVIETVLLNLFFLFNLFFVVLLLFNNKYKAAAAN